MIIVIDDNKVNCQRLSLAAKALAPSDRVVVIRVIASSFTAGWVAEDVELLTCRTEDETVEAIGRVATSENDRIIVFYDLQLLGVQEGRRVSASQITAMLADLLAKRPRVFVNIHSGEIATGEVARRIDPAGRRVLRNHVISASSQAVVERAVKETLEAAEIAWRSDDRDAKSADV
jgi:hypothetical protein